MIISRKFFLFFFFIFFNIKTARTLSPEEGKEILSLFNEEYLNASDENKQFLLSYHNFIKFKSNGWRSGVVDGARKFTDEYAFKKSPWLTNAVFSFTALYGIYNSIVKPITVSVFSFFNDKSKNSQEDRAIVKVISGVFSLLLVFAFRPGDIRNVFTSTQDSQYTLAELAAVRRDYANYVENIQKRELDIGRPV